MWLLQIEAILLFHHSVPILWMGSIKAMVLSLEILNSLSKLFFKKKRKKEEKNKRKNKNKPAAHKSEV